MPKLGLICVIQTLSRQMVEKWSADYKRGCTNIHDSASSSLTKKVAIHENVKIIHKIVLSNRKLKLQEIADTLNILTERVGFTFNEYVCVRNLCFKNGCCFFLESTKNKNISMILTADSLGFSTTTLQSQVVSQLSGQQPVILAQSDQKRRFWRSNFGMRMDFCSLIEKLKNLEKYQTFNSDVGTNVFRSGAKFLH